MARDGGKGMVESVQMDKELVNSLSICTDSSIPFSPSRAITLPIPTIMFLDTITSSCPSPPISSGGDSRGSCCASTDCYGGSGSSTRSSGTCFASFASGSSCGGSVDCGGGGGGVFCSAASASSIIDFLYARRRVAHGEIALGTRRGTITRRRR